MVKMTVTTYSTACDVCPEMEDIWIPVSSGQMPMSVMFAMADIWKASLALSRLISIAMSMSMAMRRI
jgi:hypothetical protein